MLKQILLILLFTLAAFNLSTAAQTQKGTTDVRSSVLTKINLPNGAMRVKNESVPKSISDIFVNAIEPYRKTIRQGDLEVLTWGNENFSKAESSRLMNEVETQLKKSGWSFRFEEKSADYRTFFLVQEQPRRVIFAFFAPSDRIFVFAATEIFPVDEKSSN